MILWKYFLGTLEHYYQNIEHSPSLGDNLQLSIRKLSVTGKKTLADNFERLDIKGLKTGHRKKLHVESWNWKYKTRTPQFVHLTINTPEQLYFILFRHICCWLRIQWNIWIYYIFLIFLYFKKRKFLYYVSSIFLL